MGVVWCNYRIGSVGLCKCCSRVIQNWNKLSFSNSSPGCQALRWKSSIFDPRGLSRAILYHDTFLPDSSQVASAILTRTGSSLNNSSTASKREAHGLVPMRMVYYSTSRKLKQLLRICVSTTKNINPLTISTKYMNSFVLSFYSGTYRNRDTLESIGRHLRNTL